MVKQELDAEAKETNVPQKTVNWSLKGVFWGLFFILIGLLLLLDNFNVIDVSFNNIWQLWPVLIIGVGLSVLPLRGWLGGLVSLLATVVLLGLVVVAVVDNPFYSQLQNIRSVNSVVLTDDAVGAKKLNVAIDAGAADVELSSSSGRNGVEAIQKSGGAKLVQSAETLGDTRHVVFKLESPGFLWFGNLPNSLSFDFTRTLPVVLTIDTGASNVHGDLSQLRLTNLDIDTGAGAIDLRLGAFEKLQEVKIDAGASSVTLHVPEQAGVRIESKGGLSETNFESLIKVSDTIYESADFASSDRQIIIRADLGVSSFDLKVY